MIELEQNIYNTYLATTRRRQNKPFTTRKDFSKFEENPNYQYVKKISKVFKQLPQLNMESYFNAPYEVYTNDTERFYSLEFFATLKALHCYKQYIKIKEMENPDNADQCKFIIESFKFILKFCNEQHIEFDSYLDFKVGFTPEWMKHYVDNKISIYCLLDIPNIYDRIMSIEADHRKVLLGDLESRFYSIKNMYLKSKKARILVAKGIELLRASKKEK